MKNRQKDVDSGEDYLGCAARELGEELGIVTPRSLEPLFHLPASSFASSKVMVMTSLNGSSGKGRQKPILCRADFIYSDS